MSNNQNDQPTRIGGPLPPWNSWGQGPSVEPPAPAQYPGVAPYPGPAQAAPYPPYPPASPPSPYPVAGAPQPTMGAQGGWGNQAPYDGGGERQTLVQSRIPEIQCAAWVYCSKGLRKGQLIQLNRVRNEFGRSPDSDWVVEDGFASSRHGAIVLEEGTWRIFDFASTNGTFFNHQRLGIEVPSPQELKDGDVIAIGDSEFVFKKV